MRIGIVFFIVSFFSVCGLRAQTMIYPVPQEVKWGRQMVEIPATFQLSGETTADAMAVNLLKSLLKGEKSKAGKFIIYIGKRGDKAVRKYVANIPQHPEGYYLSVTKDRIVLAGNDERGTYYAVQTLRQLLQNPLLEVEIKDYPVVRFRGVVEGFYGTPWSHEARLRQLAFYGENKMNTYIYGPKDDPYHSCPNWRKPYPEKEAEQIRELAEIARQNAVDFVWAIHPGQDIKWNEEDRNLLLAKFESMYQLGVRAFAVFFDDISGEGTNPERQADLLNDIDNHFVKVKGDVTPLIMCPTEYNKSWSNPAKGYLTTLGKKLNPGIQIMWTGDRVISDITEAGLAWVNEKIDRPAYVWWNFPVSDYVRDHLLMGAVYGLDTHIGKEMSGFVTNPMEHAEASKIAIFSVADYTWNPEKYDPQTSWIAAVRNVLPGDAESLQVFVKHNSDLGPNGHGYRREESVEITPAVERFLMDYRRGQWSSEDYLMLMNEYARIAEAADILSMNQENKPLIEEIRPWLIQFKNMGLSGMEVLAMLQAVDADDYGLFMRKYRHVKALQQESFLIDQTYNQNPYQPGVKTGSKVMRPLIDSLFVLATERYNRMHGEHLDSKVFTSPHRSYSTVAQFKSLPVSVKTNRVVVSPMLEVVKWGAGEYLGVELDKSYVAKGVEADFGVKESATWLQLETSVDGKSWTQIPLSQQGNQVKAELDAEVRFVRVVNKSDKEQEAYLRKFVVVL
ncbi:MAG: beta-N-acetylglucosaminidase domain-containing protein [Odoribacter sp.]|nr:beta-N-acetylglucosaminidase domain-containing protein [Odoribacter sp.]